MSLLIGHTDSRITYSSLWTVTPDTLEHTTSTANQYFTFEFDVSDGGTIEVHGVARPNIVGSNASHNTVVSQYSIDTGSAPVSFTSPFLGISTPQLVFFNSSKLAAGHHKLTTKVITDNIPFFFDFLQVNSPTPAPASSPPPQPLGLIVGWAVTGGLLVTSLVVCFLLFLRLRRAKQNLRQQQTRAAAFPFCPTAPVSYTSPVLHTRSDVSATRPNSVRSTLVQLDWAALRAAPKGRFGVQVGNPPAYGES